MSHEAVSSGLRLEVPYHQTGVHGASGKLLHVGAERYTGNCVPVALEMALQAWVFLSNIMLFQLKRTILSHLHSQRKPLWYKKSVQGSKGPHCVGKYKWQDLFQQTSISRAISTGSRFKLENGNVNICRLKLVPKLVSHKDGRLGHSSSWFCHS
jgi:hypothetical protein